MDMSTWPSHREHYLPALTLPTIQSLPDKSRAVVVLATAAIEQHGPHLPIGVDALLAEAYLERAIPLAAQSCSVYTLPTITIGKSNEHTGFPGTLILHRETLRQQILAVGRQVADWGFCKLAVLNTHGGNTSVVKSCLRELYPRLRVRLLDFPYSRECNEREARFGIHAGEVESALMYALTPDLVRPQLADCCWIGSLEQSGELRAEFSPATYAWQTSDLSSTGTMGDATRASVANGQLWLDRASKVIAQAITAFSQSESAKGADKV
jgi:creatinine amidohydrolase